MYLNSDNADTNSSVYKILEDLSSNAAQFQNEAMAEKLAKIYGGRPEDVPQSVLEGIQSR